MSSGRCLKRKYREKIEQVRKNEAKLVLDIYIRLRNNTNIAISKQSKKMQNPIKFYGKNVYGRISYYIADEKTSWLITGLTGKKTVSPQDIENLKQLGLKFEMIIDPEITK